MAGAYSPAPLELAEGFHNLWSGMSTRQTNGGLIKGRKEKDERVYSLVKLSHNECIKGWAYGLSPSMQKDASSNLRAWGWGPEVLAGMGKEGTPVFNTAHLQSQAP